MRSPYATAVGRKTDLKKLGCLYIVIITCSLLFFFVLPAEFCNGHPQTKNRVRLCLVIVYIYPPASEIFTLICVPVKLRIYVKFPEVALIWEPSWQDSHLYGAPCLEDRIGRLWLKLVEKGMSPP